MDEQLGPYRIRGEVGRGGMGVVYHAVDTRLDRDVAIKALPEDLADDPGRLSRFEREAKTLASLSHPNLAGIYGIEEHDGGKYLILEFVEGETLADRLDRGTMPIDEALEVALQIAAGLEAAHDAGVVHRDLKPANIKITPDDKVKVLDFGLAKSTDVSTSGIDVSQSPTVSRRIDHSPTIPGAILGTAPYMSPEQARGRSVDRRTDIWAFGVLLYEMLVGVGPFVGETATDSIGAILHKDVDFSRLPERTPSGVRRVLLRCMNRDKTHRLQSIGDARVELAEALTLYESGQVEAHSSVRAKRGWLWPTAAGVLLLGLIAVVGTHPMVSGPAAVVETETTRAIVGIEQLTDDPDQELDADLSPDGRSVVFTAWNGEHTDIYFQRVGGVKRINLTSDSDANDHSPEVSPDGDSIAFVSTREGGGVFVMGATGESPTRVCDFGFDPTWSPDGTKLICTTEYVQTAYGRTSEAQLWLIDVDSREREMIAGGDAVGARFSPDGRWIAYWAATNGQRDIWVMPGDGGEPVAITMDAYTDWCPMFSRDSAWLYFISDRNGRPNLWRVPFDASAGRAGGEPMPVTSGIAWIDEADMSADGSKILCSARRFSGEMVSLAFDAETERVVGEPRTIYEKSEPMIQFAVHPDGDGFVMRTFPPQEDIVVMNADGTGLRRLTDDMDRDRGPEWTADGEHIVFFSNRSGRYSTWAMRANGTDQRIIVEHPDRDLSVVQVSPDGRMLAIGTTDERLSRTVLVPLDRAINEIDTPVVAEGHEIENFIPEAISPDGAFLLGYSVTDAGDTALTLLDLSSRATRPIRSAQGAILALDDPGNCAWIDSDRMLYRDSRRGGVFVQDVVSGDEREIDGVPEGELRLSRDGRTLYVNQWNAASDLWILTVDDLAE